MADGSAEWEQRISALWAEIGDHDGEGFVALVDGLAAELPQGNATALFERASARDSSGRSDRAVPLYEAALSAGLVGERRRRATIQLASSLRNLGSHREAVDLLTAELDSRSSVTGSAAGKPTGGRMPTRVPRASRRSASAGSPATSRCRV
ncbi:MAG: tetratricopeptide repeat protein [Actinobacteria bacterium]|nr:tetratricopeptide repeat protein [Actinomycetota bacterium]